MLYKHYIVLWGNVCNFLCGKIEINNIANDQSILFDDGNKILIISNNNNNNTNMLYLQARYNINLSNKQVVPIDIERPRDSNFLNLTHVSRANEWEHSHDYVKTFSIENNNSDRYL